MLDIHPSRTNLPTNKAAQHKITHTAESAYDEGHIRISLFQLPGEVHKFSIRTTLLPYISVTLHINMKCV